MQREVILDILSHLYWYLLDRSKEKEEMLTQDLLFLDSLEGSRMRRTLCSLIEEILNSS